MKLTPKVLAEKAYKLTLKRKEPFHYVKMYEEITGKKYKSSYSTDVCQNFRTYLDNNNRFINLGGEKGYFSLMQWFDEYQTRLDSNKDTQKINWNKDIIAQTAIIDGPRIKYIMDWFGHGPMKQMLNLIEGKSVENHIIEFFKEKYGEFIVKANNKIEEPDKGWDFKFEGKKNIYFDVKSKVIDKLWIKKTRYGTCHIYLACKKTNNQLDMIGWCMCGDMKINSYGTNYEIEVGDLRLLDNLFLYLDHYKYGFDNECLLHKRLICVTR